VGHPTGLRCGFYLVLESGGDGPFPGMIDSHAHLDSPRYDEDRVALLERAWEAGVRGILSIGIGDGPAEMHRASEISREFEGRAGTPKIWATAGVHPHEARLWDEAAADKLGVLLGKPEVIACGEIGLDYFYDNSPRETQRAVFSRQMEIAAGRRKPIVIHCRPSNDSTDAWDETLAMLGAEWAKPGLGGVLHCFTGELRHAQAAIELGFLISFAGNVTFPKAQAIRDAATALPLEKMLIETDAPFLSPVPNRGKRNEPAWVKEVAMTIAGLRSVDVDAVIEQTTSNFGALFGVEILAGQPHHGR
jgi:TatD DNase family protein